MIMPARVVTVSFECEMRSMQIKTVVQCRVITTYRSVMHVTRVEVALQRLRL